MPAPGAVPGPRNGPAGRNALLWVGARGARHATLLPGPVGRVPRPRPGVTGFLQRDDRRLKAFVTAECFVYVLHRALLGRPPAASSAAVSGIRTLLSVWFRSAWLAAAAVAADVGQALALSTRGAGWTPAVGSSLGAIAILTMEGVPMRLALLVSTAAWLVNNASSGSVGGTVLEALIAAASLTTIARMARGAAAEGRAASTEVCGTGG